MALVAIAIAQPADAQLLEGGARAIGLGRASVAVGGDPWAESNPSGWATVDQVALDLFASQSFGLAELRTVALAVVAPSRVGTIAIAVRTYGSSGYRETRGSIGLGRLLPIAPGRHMALGLRGDYHSVVIGDGFGSFGAVDLSVGLQVDVAPALRAGLAARNLAAIARSDSSELRAPLSTSPALAGGLSYHPSPTTLVVLDIVKDLDFPMMVRAGVEVRPVDALALRVGAYVGGAGAPARLTFGAGVRAGSLAADVAVEWHETLGPSPAFGLGVRF